jgi:hypothetical protein
MIANPQLLYAGWPLDMLWHESTLPIDALRDMWAREGFLTTPDALEKYFENFRDQYVQCASCKGILNVVNVSAHGACAECEALLGC